MGCLNHNCDTCEDVTSTFECLTCVNKKKEGLYCDFCIAGTYFIATAMGTDCIDCPE